MKKIVSLAVVATVVGGYLYYQNKEASDPVGQAGAGAQQIEVEKSEEAGAIGSGELDYAEIEGDIFADDPKQITVAGKEEAKNYETAAERRKAPVAE